MASADREGDGRCAGERWDRRQHAPPAPRRPRLPRGHKLEALYGDRRRIAWISAQQFFVDQDCRGRGEDSDATHEQAASRDLLPRLRRRPPVSSRRKVLPASRNAWARYAITASLQIALSAVRESTHRLRTPQREPRVDLGPAVAIVRGDSGGTPGHAGAPASTEQ